MHIMTYGMSTDKLAGIETFLLNMNQFMLGNVIFDYIIEGEETIHQERIKARGGKIHFIAHKRHMLQNIFDWNHLLKNAKKESGIANIVYFNMYSLAWIVPIFQCKWYGYEVVIHAHNNNLHDCGFVLQTLHKVNREILKHMKIHRFTNSSLSTEFFFGNRSAEMVYNAIDTQRFSYDQAVREKIRVKLRYCGKHVYGFAGRIVFQKNPLFLIEVFNEIRRLDPNSAFLVCGDGDMMGETKKLAESKGLKVDFVGARHNVQDYYQAMDVFILPSRFEGLGIVLIEAQAAGLPCVTSADVVPKDAKVTELLEYIPLDKGAKEWAKLCVKKYSDQKKERSAYSRQVHDSMFEIRKEGPRLETMLMQCNAPAKLGGVL